VTSGSRLKAAAPPPPPHQGAQRSIARAAWQTARAVATRVTPEGEKNTLLASAALA
jgi:hypothetical protein